MSRPIVAVLTDFGVRDHYVAAMKAVILSICPDVTLVDITHEIPPQDVRAGAYELAACYRFFPASTIFLAVVDPGVGSGRHAMVAETSAHRFVAPDNGLLTAVFAETPPRRVVQLTERGYARPTLSRTFEGRDRFAPAAAWLAKGVDISAVGRPLAKYELLDLPQPAITEGTIAGEVRHVDRFGNLITNIDRKIVEKVGRGGSGAVPGGDVRVSIGDRVVGRIVATYADVPPGEVCALFGSSDHLEIAANGASAAAAIGAGRGAAVTVVCASAFPSTLA
jgi:S-adenosylmethionine hydrolase